MDDRAVCFVTQSRLKRREMEDLKGVNKGKKNRKKSRETVKKEFTPLGQGNPRKQSNGERTSLL